MEQRRHFERCMMKIRNDRLKIHIISVGHGDSILIEMPDLKGKNGENDKASIGLVDAGGFDDQRRKQNPGIHQIIVNLP